MDFAKISDQPLASDLRNTGGQTLTALQIDVYNISPGKAEDGAQTADKQTELWEIDQFNNMEERFVRQLEDRERILKNSSFPKIPTDLQNTLIKHSFQDEMLHGAYLHGIDLETYRPVGVILTKKYDVPYN